MGQSPSWEASASSASQNITPQFMEAEDSLPSSQKPATYHTLSKINAVRDLILFN